MKLLFNYANGRNAIFNIKPCDNRKNKQDKKSLFSRGRRRLPVHQNLICLCFVQILSKLYYLVALDLLRPQNKAG